MDGRTDVAIVGGGAAGIAAARRLSELGWSALIVEALPRLGGRAHTAEIDGLPLDLGCGWLHSAGRNPLARLAQAQGLELIHGQGAWRHRLPPALAGLQDQTDAWRAYAAFSERLAAAPPASDCAGDAWPADDPWRPFADALSGFVNGVELDQLSAADFLAYEEASGASNWRLAGGYGAFIVSQARDTRHLLSTRVRAVTQGDDVVLETDSGAIAARAAIVTVSTTALATGAIRFTPAIDDHFHAAANLPLGLADKVFFRIADARHVPSEAHLLGRLDRARTGSYYLRPLSRPVIEVFLGGANAKALEREGERAAVAFAEAELAGLFGRAFVKDIAPIAVTAWGREPGIGGSYSHALPGHADARADLARPVSPRLCLAGEACSPKDFSTAHGAWQSGLAAADWIAQGLGPAPTSKDDAG